MWLVAGTFAGIFLLFVTLYWLVVLRPETAAERALTRRLRPQKRDVARTFSVTHEITPRSTVPLLNRALNRFVAATRPIEHLIARTDLRVTTGRFVLGTVFAGVCGFSIGTLAVNPWVGLFAGVICASMPLFALRAIAGRRVTQFEEQFPEAIDLIARALRAGHALTTGFDIVASEVAEPARSEFKLLHDRQTYGMPLPDALRLFAERVPLVDARFFATAVLTQREAGGNLAEVLDSLAATIRDRFRMKRQVRVASAHGRISAVVLSCLPLGMALILAVSAPEHLRVLVTDPLGVRMLLLAGVLQIIGVFAIRRIVNIEI